MDIDFGRQRRISLNLSGKNNKHNKDKLQNCTIWTSQQNNVSIIFSWFIMFISRELWSIWLIQFNLYWKGYSPHEFRVLNEMLTHSFLVLIADLIDNIEEISLTSWYIKGNFLVVCSPYLILLVAFIGFVCWNGSIVLGTSYLDFLFNFLIIV